MIQKFHFWVNKSPDKMINRNKVNKTMVCIKVIFIIAPNWKTTQTPVNRRMDKQNWYNHSTEYYSVVGKS